MREILFRAKRIDNGEWQEGYLFDDGMVETKHYFVGWICVEPYKGTACDTWTITGIDFCEIDPETICQYTGLKDKNGNRIWENDIVRTTKFGKDDGNGHNYAGFDVFVVKWDDGGFALFNKWRRFNLRTDEKSYEILGKVFDNPELLKGE